MNKLKTFFYSFKKSLTDFNYYLEIVKAKFSFSLKYLFLLLIFVSFFTSISFASSILKTIPKVPSFVEKGKILVNKFYPKELEITIKDGSLSTNIKEPYFIKMPQEFMDKNNASLNLITIDTTAKVEDIKKYNTALLVTKNAVVYPDKNEQYKVSFLNKVPDYKIDKKIYDQLAAKLLSYSKYIIPVMKFAAILSLIVLPFIMAPLALMGKLIYLLFMTVPLFILALILKKKLSYGKVYQLSIHGLTIPIVLDLVIESLRRLTYISETSFVYNLSWISFLVFMVIVLSKLKPNLLMEGKDYHCRLIDQK